MGPPRQLISGVSLAGSCYDQGCVVAAFASRQSEHPERLTGQRSKIETSIRAAGVLSRDHHPVLELHRLLPAPLRPPPPSDDLGAGKLLRSTGQLWTRRTLVPVHQLLR
jgi:hypothetical protein